jgi:hypothetical protein
MTTRRSWVLCGILAFVFPSVFVLAGCGGNTSSSQPAAQTTPAATQAQPPASTGQPEQTPAAAPSTPPATPASPGAATAPPPPTSLMVQEHETGVEVTLVEVKRTAGDSVTAKWRYRNTAASDVKLLKGGTAWSEPYKLTADAFVIDPVNKKKYLVITDAERYPLSSKHGDWQGFTLAPGQSLSAWAKFPAPPADVEKVTVAIPGVPPFEDVPIIK